MSQDTSIAWTQRCTMSVAELAAAYWAVEKVMRRRLLKCFRAGVDPKRAARIWRCRLDDALIVFAWWRSWQCA